MNNKPCAEIVASTLHAWTAQCWQWNVAPAFGSLVTVTSGKRTLFGVVHQIETGSLDPARYPFAYQKTYEELLAEQPQIFEFLKTSISCIALGYQEKGTVYYITPAQPPLIHSFVSPIEPDLAKQFFYNQQFMHILFAPHNSTANSDELLLALIKQQAQLGILKQEKLHSLIQHFLLLTGNDYRRLKLFLSRVESLITMQNT
jgi:hypothetical protein